MTFPTFDVGEVISYEYLWSREHASGQRVGLKTRPCAVIVAITTSAGHRHIYLAPITHRRPDADGVGVEVPRSIKKALRLDEEPSWIIVNELNKTVLPAPEILKTPHGEWSYGFLPKSFFKTVYDAIMSQEKQRALSIPDRDKE